MVAVETFSNFCLRTSKTAQLSTTLFSVCQVLGTKIHVQQKEASLSLFNRRLVEVVLEMVLQLVLLRS